MSDTLRTILYATELGLTAEVEWAHALRLAASTGAALHAVHVQDRAHAVDPLPVPGWAPVVPTWHLVSDDSVTHGLVRTILEVRPDLLVMGSHRRTGLDRLVHGSIAEDLTRRAGIVTLFVGTGTRPLVRAADGACSLTRVLLPVDSDHDRQQRAVDVAAFVTGAFVPDRAVDFVALHVGTEETFPALVTLPRPGWTWRRSMRGGPVVPAVRDCAEEVDADLVVMATRGEDGLADTLFGTRTEHVLRSVRCPVLVVPV